VTNPEKMKRLYILLKWYDYFAASPKMDVPEEDFKLALQLQYEMDELQAEAFKKKKNKKVCTTQVKASQTKSK